HKVRFMRRHDISWKKCNAITRASRSSLRCLAVGAKCEPRVTKLLSEPLGFRNKVTALVETDEGRSLPSPQLVAIRRRCVEAEGNICYARGNKVVVLGRPVPQCDIRFTLSEADDPRPADHLEVDRWIAFVKRTETIDKEALSQHAANS